MPKLERLEVNLRFSEFGFRASVFFRHSSFSRHSTCRPRTYELRIRRDSSPELGVSNLSAGLAQPDHRLWPNRSCQTRIDSSGLQRRLARASPTLRLRFLLPE